MIKAVVFDLDGVLVDAKDWHYEALNRALALFGYEISRYEHVITYDGLPTRQKLEMLSLERGLPRDLHCFINELKQKYTVELIHARCRPTFQHEYALSRLQAEGYRLAVASNSIRKSIDLMLELTALGRYFEVILSNQDVTQSKPHPDIYLKTFQQLELRCDQCLVVEDNDNGIRAARTAGAPVLIVQSVEDVRYDRITEEIRKIEAIG